MVREVVLGLLIVAALASAGASAFAQTAAPEPAVAPSEQAPPLQQVPPEASAPPAAAAAGAPREAVAPGQTRFQVRAMEGILEESVVQAARRLNGQLRKVSPDLVQLTGAARARGYQLEGYGMFFDVEVPAAMRHTMGVTLRMLRQNNEYLEQALTSLRQLAASQSGKSRQDAETAIRHIELQLRPQTAGGRPTPGGTAIIGGSVWAASSRESKVSASSAPAEAPAATSEHPPAQQPAPEGSQPSINPLWIESPDLVYESEVREALVSAMVDFGQSLAIGPNEWLTVAARDNENFVLPNDAADVVTIILRLKGSDLGELRAGRLTPAEVRKRVEVREF